LVSKKERGIPEDGNVVMRRLKPINEKKDPTQNTKTTGGVNPRLEKVRFVWVNRKFKRTIPRPQSKGKKKRKLGKR